MNSPNYRENKNIPFAGNYHSAAECFKAGGTAGGCADAALWAGIATDGSGTPTVDASYYFFYNSSLLGASSGTYGSASLITQYNAISGNVDVSDLDGLITGQNSTYFANAPGAQKTGVTLTDAQINTSLTRMFTQYRGVGHTSGLVSVARAADIKADDTGQFGVNLSGYVDDIGNGVEWGLYFNNSHSNAPRVRYLTIADGYASTLYAMYNLQNLAKDYTDATVTAFEQIQSSVAYGSLICGVVYKAATTTAGSPAAAAYGQFAQNATSTASYLHDPGKCYATIDALATIGGTAAYDADPGSFGKSLAAAISGTKVVAHGQTTAAATGARATLGLAKASRYQL
jgi:hypothetical protein